MFARRPPASRRAAGRPPWRTRLARVSATLLVLVAAPALVLFWMFPPARVADMSPDTHALTKLERVPMPELGRGFERWHMIGARRDTVMALWRGRADGTRAASDSPGRDIEWTVVILGGIGTDDRAALLVPDSLPVNVLAVSWPWRGSRRMSRARFVASVPALRAALLRTPACLARGVHAARRVKPEARVALLGASLGVPPTVAALPNANADALVLVDGAADLRRLLHSETSRVLGGGPVALGLAAVSSPFAAWLLSPLEPARRAPGERDIPTMLVDAEDEERLPRECVAKLHARFPRATRATHPGKHLRPEDREQLEALMQAVWRWLESPAARS